MPFYTKRMVRFLEGKEGKHKRKHSHNKPEKGLRIAPSTVGADGGGGGSSSAKSGVKGSSVGGGGGGGSTSGGKPSEAEVLTAEPKEQIPDNAFDQKKLQFMKTMLKAAVDRIDKEKASLPVSHRYFSRYAIQTDKLVAETAACKVYKAQHQDFKDNVLAVKTYEGEHGIDGNGAVWLKILRILGKKHPNVIQTWDVFFSPEENNKLLIIQELANKGSLATHLNSNQVDEKQAGSWLWQLLKAIDYLGDVGVSHRSIQPKHILLTNKDLKLKLTGFESAAVYWDPVKEDIKNVACVPLEQRPTDPNAPSFQAPEVYGDPAKEEFDPMVADVWSIGATAYYMLTKQYPYDISKVDTISADIQSNISKIQGISDDGKRCLSEMLKPTATERKYIDKLMSDPWLKGFR
ncbi:testis-specific serine/threonine-protein kinase 1-like [Oppia nitens]|uniref:testis-specific serine/threonine-protein kinase 1-like n=1 Tax=Oppia nitens TaxID=1686743 RepID=UPI0023DCC98B|nr:testis-specific serine/threonine-protein kinase 1-like [Oppia nitens]